MIGLLGCTLLFTSVVIALCRVQRYSMATRGMIVLFATGVAWLPLNGLFVCGYIRGITGDLSVTSLVLMTLFCLSRLLGKEIISPFDFSRLMWLTLAGGLFLYPLALGLTYFDPYALGYQSKGFVIIFLMITIIAWKYNLNLILACLLLGMTAYTLNLFESRNLWDYVIDPLVTLYALFWILRHQSFKFWSFLPKSFH